MINQCVLEKHVTRPTVAKGISYILRIISLLTGDMNSDKLTSLPMCGFIAQLVEHRTGIAEVTGSNSVEAPGGVLGSIFAGYVPLASQNPYPIIVYSVANYRPHLSHFWANVIFAIPS